MIDNLLKYVCAKNYRNKWSSDKAVAKIKRCSFFASQCTFTVIVAVTDTLCIKETTHNPLIKDMCGLKKTFIVIRYVICDL